MNRIKSIGKIAVSVIDKVAIPACPFRVEYDKRYLHITASCRLSFSLGTLKLSFADKFIDRLFLWYGWISHGFCCPLTTLTTILHLHLSIDVGKKVIFLSETPLQR